MMAFVFLVACSSTNPAAELREAETEAMLEVSRSGKTSTVMIDVVLYDSDEVVGQYAVAVHA